MKLPSIKDKELDFSGKVVLLREDLNVPMDESGLVTDESRIQEAVPTIRYLIQKGARTVVMTHIGRPEGKVIDSLRTEPVAAKLSMMLKQDVNSLKECIGGEVEASIKKVKDGEVIFLENLRFHKEEEENDEKFAKALASLGDIYVNDAFAVCHRNNASVTGIPKHLPSYAGLLLEKEIKTLAGALEKPKRPFVVVLGGAKVSDKIGVIRNLAQKADKILIGGAMMFTFYRSRGFEVGSSKVEPDMVSVADDLINEFNGKIMLPVDVVVADRAAGNARRDVVTASEIPKGWLGLDIGPESIKIFCKEISEARTIIWNGPLGLFELDMFAEGTVAIAKAVSEMTSRATTIIGGGDTLAAVDKAGLKGRFSHSSTGGGAMLEFLEGKTLPGVAALQN